MAEGGEKMKHASEPELSQPSFVAVAPSVPAPTLYTATGAPVQIVNMKQSNGTFQHYRSKAARYLGLLQIFLGILICITQIVVTIEKAPNHEGFSGFWAPPIFILAGICGLLSCRSKSQTAVIATLIISILGAALTFGPIIQGAIGMTADDVCDDSFYITRHHNHDHDNDDDDDDDDDLCHGRIGFAFHTIMMILGLVEAIVAVVAAAYCCHGCCCHRSKPRVVISQVPVMASPVSHVSGGMSVHYQQNHDNVAVEMSAAASGNGSAYQTPLDSPPAYCETDEPPAYTEKV